MSEQHYFTAQPQTPTDEMEFTETLLGHTYRFITDTGVFSKDRVDAGSKLLLEAVEFPQDGLICDLGCGYGPIGIVAAHESPQCLVHMVDINERAVGLAVRNLANNGLSNAQVFSGDGFTALPAAKYALILTNPPIRAGKKVIYPMVHQAWERLENPGRLCLVIRTKQGAKSMEKHMEAVFGNVETIAKGGGYRILQSVKQG